MVALQEAQRIARELVERLGSVCQRIAIAGSIRRQKLDVGDIELLCIPKYARGIDLLDKELGALLFQRILTLRRNKKGFTTYGPKNKLMVHVESGMAVDLFSSTEENWGMALFVRTGPKEWNIRAMVRFRELGTRGHAYGGISTSDGKEIACPDEQTVFRYLGWSYSPPERRMKR